MGEPPDGYRRQQTKSSPSTQEVPEPRWPVAEPYCARMLALAAQGFRLRGTGGDLVAGELLTVRTHPGRSAYARLSSYTFIAALRLGIFGVTIRHSDLCRCWR